MTLTACPPDHTLCFLFLALLQKTCTWRHVVFLDDVVFVAPGTPPLQIVKLSLKSSAFRGSGLSVKDLLPVANSEKVDLVSSLTRLFNILQQLSQQQAVDFVSTLLTLFLTHYESVT